MFKYIKLADLLKTTLTRNIQLKDLIYPSSSSSPSTQSSQTKVDPRVAYSNLSLITNNLTKFQTMYKKLSTQLKKNKQNIITNKYLLFVVVAEYINVGKIVGGGKLKRVVMGNLGLLPQVEVQSKINKRVVHVRLRGNCADQQEYEKWSAILQKFQPNPIIPNLFNLTHTEYSTLCTSNPSLRDSPACIVQSFSSTLPPFLLFSGINLDKASNKNKHFNIIDACSAPGNKTLQLSEYLGQRGTVYAFEKDQRRFLGLERNMGKYGVENVRCVQRNFMEATPGQYPNVKLIMLDPSCSGSGMLINFTRDNSDSVQTDQTFQQFVDRTYTNLDQKQKSRLTSLKSFQLQLLTHASSLNPQRISYSTCSIHRQENEEVVQQFLALSPQYEIKPVARKLKGYGCMVAGFGEYRECVRVDPRLRVSDGFFVCVFGRKK